MKQIPSLIALSYLEAAIRTKSFVSAAKELHITPGAVSQQIKALEEYLGVELFVRHNRRVSPTPAAKAALTGLQEGFATLEQAVEQIRMFGDSKWVITVCAEPLFATKWIVPRLHHFYERCPEAEVRLQASLNTIDCNLANLPDEAAFRRAGIDLSVRLGYGQYSDLDAERLLKLEIAPICSPAMAKKISGPKSLLNLSLLSDRSLSRFKDLPGWRDWFEDVGVQLEKPIKEQVFGNGLLSLEAAVAGQGCVLSSADLLEGEIRSGNLSVGFDSRISCPQAYYVVSTKQSLSRPIAKEFREWLIDSVA